MNASLLAISIGNTHTRIAAFVEGKIVERRTAPSADAAALADAIESAFAPLRDQEEETAVVLASVDPRVAEQAVAAVRERLGLEARRVERDLPIPIGRQLDRESIIGEDRLLNAAAAYDTLKQNCVVIDAGTAITVDFIDGAGTFHGGAIAPGAAMMLRSLHEGTAQLPEVAMARPEEPIGHSTAEAMRTGAFHGLRGMVRELVEQYAEVAGSYPTVVATGGDAELLFSDYELVERIVPDLTLLGIAVTLEATRRAAEEG